MRGCGLARARADLPRDGRCTNRGCARSAWQSGWPRRHVCLAYTGAALPEPACRRPADPTATNPDWALLASGAATTAARRTASGRRLGAWNALR